MDVVSHFFPQMFQLHSVVSRVEYSMLIHKSLGLFGLQLVYEWTESSQSPCLCSFQPYLLNTLLRVCEVTERQYGFYHVGHSVKVKI